MLVQWTPFRDMARLQRDLNRFFDGATPARAGEHATWSPAVDVIEDSEKFELRADLPGVKEETLDIQVNHDVLTVRGTRAVAEEQYQRIERTFGSFARSFTLPKTVDVEKIAATLRDGVLTVTLPKRPEAQPRQIKVAVAK